MKKENVAEDRLLKIEEVALLVGKSVKTINNWYWFKRLNPENELAQMLPDYVQENSRQQRFWKQSDIWKLIEFAQRIPKGRNGIMASVTQRYYTKSNKGE